MSKQLVGILLWMICPVMVALAADPLPAEGQAAQRIVQSITNAEPLPVCRTITPTLDIAAITAACTQQVQGGVQEFVRAFNAHDAKAVAAEWSLHGTYIDQEGTVYKGREAIEKLYQNCFTECPETKVAVAVQDVRLINAFTAIEHGITMVTVKPGAEPTGSRYIATHVRQGTNWVMISVEDLPDATVEKFVGLKDMEWLVGTWRAVSGGLSNDMTITRVGDGPFFQRTWTTWSDTNVLVRGVQVIGWDPDLRQIASWTFDSRGNTDKGLWSPDVNGWAIECTGMLVNGTPFSATYIMSMIGDDTLAIRSTNRSAGDVALPDIPDVTLTRVAR